MRAISRFLIIDDDPSNNFLCEIMLKKTIAGMDIQSFIQPEIAVDYIKKEYSNGIPGLSLAHVRSIFLIRLHNYLYLGWQ